MANNKNNIQDQDIIIQTGKDVQEAQQRKRKEQSKIHQNAKQQRKALKLFLALTVIVLLVVPIGYAYLKFSSSNEETSNAITQKNISEEVEVYFCPQDNCLAIITEIFTNSQHLECAFFDLDEQLIELLDLHPNAKILLDKRQYIYRPYAIMSTNNHYMHHKFCIINNKIVLTGSTNPTQRGLTQNNNNIVLINNKDITEQYKEAFTLLTTKGYGTPTPVFTPTLRSIHCPSVCEEEVLQIIENANKSIHAMLFSFTSQKIANIMLNKSKAMPVTVVTEASQSGGSSVYRWLQEMNINSTKDGNKAFMHNKVFIIDKQYVITGSTNPSTNGFTKNNENVLIINSSTIAAKYLEEFNKIYAQAIEKASP